MKKIIALLCILTCMSGLVACGSAETVNEIQVSKQANAEQYAVESIIPLMTESITIDQLLQIYEAGGYTSEEWESVVYTNFELSVDGEAYLKGLDSFLTGLENMGGIVEIGTVSSVVSDEEIIVYVDVLGEVKNGQVEIILSNDYFTKLKSCTLNVDATFEEKMTNAALNTLLGMGTVFAVLIFIMCIISAFAIIPKIQDKLANKETRPEKKVVSAKAKEEDLALVAAIAAATAYEKSKNDTELVAVIAAAVAAYRGETTTDNFVVRSIKKIKRR